MTSSQRIIVNTAAQYTRTIINVCLSLYSTRLILAALGQTDYGIFSVVAGVVAMLSFMTNALVTTTQRYLSFYHGKGEKEKIRQMFANSLLLHILIGGAVLVVLAGLAYPVIYSLLKIEAGREMAALTVYIATVLMLSLTFLTAPFRALFVARENIVYISVIDVLDGVLRLIIAIFLTYIVSYDKLITYSFLLIGISIFNLLAFAIYSLTHYEECHIPSVKEWNTDCIKELSSFAGWSIYGTGCIVIRNQGIAVLLNIFFGTIANAAYGLAQQVSGAVAFISTSILNAINPQIMKNEGAGDRQRMLTLAGYGSKYALLLLSLVSIPIIFEMDSILQLWLVDVPQYAVSFCRIMLIAAICDQITIGLTSANQATGNIKLYTIVFYTYKLLTLIAIGICMACGVNPATSLWCFVIVEFTGSFVRVVLLKYQIHISFSFFIKETLLRSILPILSMILASYACMHYVHAPYRFLYTICSSILVGCIMIWYTSLEDKEKQYINNLLK